MIRVSSEAVVQYLPLRRRKHHRSVLGNASRARRTTAQLANDTRAALPAREKLVQGRLGAARSVIESLFTLVCYGEREAGPRSIFKYGVCSSTCGHV